MQSSCPCNILVPISTTSLLKIRSANLLEIKRQELLYILHELVLNVIIDRCVSVCRYAAKDKRFLVRHGFTHVLNASEGTDSLQVNTSGDYYRNIQIKYMGIPGHDRSTWDIGQYFEETSKFIDVALKSGGAYNLTIQIFQFHSAILPINH